MRIFKSNKKKIGFKLASNNRNYEKWDRRFLNLAKNISEWSKDPSTKVGAIIVDEDRRIVSIGYNGFPKGIQDDPRILSNRDLKYKSIIHAEKNAILFASKSIKGCTIYTYPLMPCPQCTSSLIQLGIGTVVSVEPETAILNRWKEDLEISQKRLQEAGITLIIYTKDFMEKKS